MKDLFPDSEATFADSIVRLNATNPFTPERIACERDALGDEFDETGSAWNTQPPQKALHFNHRRLTARCGEVIERVRGAWSTKGRVAERDRTRYIEMVGFWLYQSYAVQFDGVIERARQGDRDALRPGFYRKFRAEAEWYFGLPGLGDDHGFDPDHLFACAFQIRRAFHHVFHSLVGGSAPMARLRAAIWQSIFSHDLSRYRRVLFNRMGDFATLITGASGTGKELVARAISFSRYVPYNPRGGGFSESFTEAFYALNLSALSPTLIESELFGHRRGAFTGAVADRAGWMEQCPATGSVFLDEIGDVDASIQVKLLRVLQSRTYQRLGDTDSREFQGKIIAATHQDLVGLMRAGRFREDFYYRLCSDLIHTPTLREQLDDCEADLGIMVAAIASRLVGVAESADFAREAQRWIEQNLGPHYPWAGNFRELEQCMRNLLVRATYRPAEAMGRTDDWLDAVATGGLSAEALLTHYTRRVFALSGTVEEASKRLQLDRRTVRARLPAAPLKRGRR
ncbi:sigma-54-dependent transcriptional regulator [Synoicihabitans lomoniglobus]|uniref:Sigma 54-interacting transcriptional regulator n=1 Tax=Synoicihabitans lomoniglobus TaxID=2909285 RepID=A0AAF0CG83_9BACT|nr:sigma 54-interacting transcriptional regulator [Opitutaceae bacterium LMO-M01]WED63272.1 sigma 54-interacting transcriptional regulator [Opitutaceae bacterium LMO-M01]